MNVTTATKWVYAFGAGRNEGRAGMRNLLGGKGANLAEMAAIGLPVPPGFTITTEVCTAFYANDRKYPAGLEPQVREALAGVEAATGFRFGDPSNPLLVSVRSGRARLDAWNDGHGAQPRPERRNVAGSPPSPATRASPGTATAASSRCSAAWCSMSTITASRRSSTR
jgi:hypothetical protein